MYFMLAVSVVYMLFAEYIVGFFTAETEVLKNGALSLRVISAGYFMYAYGLVLSQSFNGAGDTKTPTIINLVGFWAFQIPFAYLAALYWGWGPMGVFLAIALSETLLAIMCIVIFRKGKWKTVEV
jgi:Na+-driven multidrug efflux pump